MLLSIAVAGITFAGSDVGGFFGNPGIYCELFIVDDDFRFRVID
jgi:alpha-glucosidase (family GH31 glycosyl hydrolase)